MHKSLNNMKEHPSHHSVGALDLTKHPLLLKGKEELPKPTGIQDGYSAQVSDGQGSSSAVHCPWL